MITYITGSTYYQVIKSTVEGTGELIMQTEVSEEIDFYKYVKCNISKLDGMDKLIIDLSVCQNTDEEIIKALEMLRSLYDSLRIIVFAPYLETGNILLMQCFTLGIVNIINTDDFNAVHKELEECILPGKKFKDAVKYKEVKAEKLDIRREIKKNRKQPYGRNSGKRAPDRNNTCCNPISKFLEKKRVYDCIAGNE